MVLVTRDSPPSPKTKRPKIIFAYRNGETHIALSEEQHPLHAAAASHDLRRSREPRSSLLSPPPPEEDSALTIAALTRPAALPGTSRHTTAAADDRRSDGFDASSR